MLIYVSAPTGGPTGYATLATLPAFGSEYVALNAAGSPVAYAVLRSTTYAPSTYAHSGVNVDGRIELVVLPDGGPPPPPP